MDQKWFEDIMNQKHHEDICFNPSKLILLQFLFYTDEIKTVYKVRDFQEHMYRVYSDNVEVAKKHPSYIVRNLQSYGVQDLEEHARDTLESWVRDSKNATLKVGEKVMALQVDVTDANDIIRSSKRLGNMLYKKIFKGTMPEIKQLEEVLELDDRNINTFGKSSYKKRVLEDIQYCPICEEIKSDNLVCVHILEKSMGASKEQLLDKANGLIMCESHAKQFINQQFYFDELGFAHNISDSDVQEGVHLSFAIRSMERKKYLSQRLLKLQEDGIVKM